jgi:hypothetical protein
MAEKEEGSTKEQEGGIYVRLSRSLSDGDKDGAEFVDS